MSPFLKSLMSEKVMMVSKLPFAVDGVVRIVDKGGHTLAVVLDKNTIDEIDEEIQASDPKFIASLKTSRKTGRIKGIHVKRKLGLK